MLELLEIEGQGRPGGASAKRGKRVMRRAGAAKAKGAKLKRKAERRRR
jgi:hypothetical protein